MKIDCGYLCYTDEFKGGQLCIIKGCAALLKKDKSTICFFLSQDVSDVEFGTDCYTFTNYDFLRQVFGNSTTNIKLEDGYASVNITKSLEYKMYYEKNLDEEIGMIYDTIQQVEYYWEVDYTKEERQYFEGDRIVQIKNEEPYIIIEDNEFKLKMRVIKNGSTELSGAFRLNQIMPRNRKVKKLEYLMPMPNGPLFIKENSQNVLVVTPFETASGSFSEACSDGIVVWSPESEAEPASCEGDTS